LFDFNGEIAMKSSKLTWLALGGAFLVFCPLLSAHVQAQTPEAIVITFKQDLVVATPQGRNLPIIDSAAVEAACIAAALARNLQMAAEGTGQQVGMFPALAGVKLVNKTFLIQSRAGAQRCFDPDPDTLGYESTDFGVSVPDDYTLLIDLVTQFLDVGGRVVVCPLCWISRGYSETDLLDGAEIGTAATVGPLFLGAEKVIDF
jgi:predicted peroxiredoxin